MTRIGFAPEAWIALRSLPDGWPQAWQDASEYCRLSPKVGEASLISAASLSHDAASPLAGKSAQLMAPMASFPLP